MQCPICENPNAEDITLTTFDGRMIHCPECGDYDISGTLLARQTLSGLATSIHGSSSKSPAQNQGRNASDSAHLRSLNHRGSPHVSPGCKIVKLGSPRPEPAPVDDFDWEGGPKESSACPNIELLCGCRVC